MNDKNHFWAWFWFVISALYAISPIDIAPDFIPIAGWIDDIAISGAGVINLIQSYVKNTNETLSKILGLLKWVLLFMGIIIALILGIIGFVAYKSLT